MKLHSNAKLTPKGRLALAQAVKEGRLTLNAAAAAFKVSERTARKWVQRFEAEGPAGLQDRSSRPMHLRAATPPKVVRRIEQLRRERMTGARIAELTGVSTATVSRAAPRGPVEAVIARSRGACQAIRAPGRWRHAAPGHQEARSHRQAGSPRDRRPNRAQPRRRLGDGVRGGERSQSPFFHETRVAKGDG